MIKRLAAAAAVTALALPAAADAHVTVQPGSAPAGSFHRLDVRVPNERDDKGTVKVDLRLPNGFYFASYEKVPGWKVKVTRSKLDRPVDLGGFSVSSRVTRIVWTGDRKQGIIEPDQFQDFGLSVRVPDGTAGTVLRLKAYQTYAGGERVAWTGGEDAETPAPTLTLTAATGHH
jgi:periplasmic copper chaperone A